MRALRRATAALAALAGVAGASVPAAASAPATFAVVTLNVHHQHTAAQRAHDVRIAAGMGGVVGWQEAQDHATVKRALGDAWATYAPSGDTPVSWRTDVWRLRDTGNVHASDGLERVSPERWVTWALLEHRASGVKLALVNNHMIAHGWCRHFPNLKDEIRARWAHHVRVLGHVVADLDRRADVVVVVGDMNRDRYPILGDRVRYDLPWRVVTNGRRQHYDQIDHVPARRVRAVGWDVNHFTVSHHAAARVTYEVRR